jgi:DNA mismatch endonuclease, patch repair protein
MRRITAKNTKPELLVRRILYSLGYRYRLHAKDLPGKPDIVFRSRKIAILVHGCFWHQHESCREGRVPNSRREYWVPKLERNNRRDKENLAALSQLGWRILVVWECEAKDLSLLEHRLRDYLASPSE